MHHARRMAVFLCASSLLFAGCKKEEAVPIPLVPSDITMEAEFKSFLSLGFPEQDVFVEVVKNSPQVHRFEVVQPQHPEKYVYEFLKPVFAAAAPVPHDPFEVGKAPTLQKGKRLGLVLQQWSNGYGYGKYTVKDSKATLKVRFRDLMRGGRYSLWCAQSNKDTFREKPCSIEAPLFEADGKGRGTYELSFPAPPDSTTETGSWLMLAFHSDRQQKPTLNDFGKGTHVQLLFRVPSLAELKPVY